MRIRNPRRYYQDSSRRFPGRGSRKNTRSRSLTMSIVIVMAALLIVLASRVINHNEKEAVLIAPSYGFQSSASFSEKQSVKILPQSEVPAGTRIDEYKGIPVYSNGANYMSDHGLNYSEDGYYYGYKWQCVEFVKRFYYLEYGHEMPDGAGHAKYFYIPALKQGEFNEQRGLNQYHNGGDVKPKEDDLLVFTKGAYGHVAIISEVGDGWLEVVQQNSEVPRERYTLSEKNGTYTIIGEDTPAGWLRINQNSL